MELERQVDAWGRVTLSPSAIHEYLMRGFDPNLVMVEDTPEIQSYNAECIRRDKKGFMLSTPDIPSQSPDEEHAERASNWLLDLDPDIEIHLLDLCQHEEGRRRVRDELVLYRERNLLPFLAAMKCLVDHFRKNNIVWGVGRGSSVSSYCLYLLGVHRIDPLKYKLNISDFLRD